MAAGILARMRRWLCVPQWVIVVLVAEASLNIVAAANDPWADAPVIVRTANAWHKGEAIPAELRHFRRSGDIPAETDSAVLISQVTNLALLSALVTDLSADPECREDAFTQGMYTEGPTRFFAVLAADLSTDSANDPWLKELHSRIAKPHVWVDALFIEDSDMPRTDAIKVLDRIEGELRGGAKWANVYRKYADDFGYKTSNRTKIGNLGDLIVFRDPALGRGHYVKIAPNGITWVGRLPPRRLSRLAYFDASHLPSIMNARTGDVIRLHSSEYSEFVLYQVREVYPGER